MNAIAIRKLITHFGALQELVPLKPIQTEADYDAAVASLNALIDVGAADEKHPLATLVAVLGTLIGDYDDVHYPAADVTPAEMLRFLMDQHGLTQGDLPEVGSQGVVSDILRGKRELNRRQIAGLKRRFGIGADAFV